jgi:hypothetical protein
MDIWNEYVFQLPMDESMFLMQKIIIMTHVLCTLN